MVDLYIVMLVYQRVKPPFSYDFPWFSIGYWMTEISAPTYSVTLNPKDLGDISAHHIFFRPAMCGEKNPRCLTPGVVFRVFSNWWNPMSIFGETCTSVHFAKVTCLVVRLSALQPPLLFVASPFRWWISQHGWIPICVDGFPIKSH